jgi:hypothetical protein
MKITFLQKAGGLAVIAGGLMLAVYAICYFTVLPLQTMATDFIGAVRHPAWIPLAVTAFVAVIALLFGFAALYSRIYEKTGLIGFFGFVLIEIAYLTQLAKVTWEIFIYPIIANNASAAFLLTQKVIKNDPGVGLFRGLGSTTIILGTTLFCIALIKSTVIPKTAGILIFCGAMLYGLGPLLNSKVAMAGVIILALGCLQAGVSLFRNVKQ